MSDYYRGYKIHKVGSEWLFVDPSISENFEQRPCGYCGGYNTVDGHDACIANLPGVMNACCGHGQERDAYVQFNDGSSVHGEKAIELQGKLLSNKSTM